MSDPFNILGSEFDLPPTFDEAVRDTVTRFRTSVQRFGELADALSEEDFTDSEWRIVETAAADLEEAVERAEDGYIAVQYDSHGWYRIMESLQRIQLRLDSAIGVMELVQARVATGPDHPASG